MPAKAGIQYAAAFIGIETAAFTGSSAFADDDSGNGLQFLHRII
jgi:hypothetical protein